MICPKCGAQIEDGANFCTNCGATIGEETPKTGVGVSLEKDLPPVPVPHTVSLTKLEPETAAKPAAASPLTFGTDPGPTPKLSFGADPGPAPQPSFGTQQGPAPQPSFGTQQGPAPQPSFGTQSGMASQTGFAGQPQTNTMYAGTAMSGGTNRSIPLFIILTLATCGLFGLYWMYQLNEDANRLTGEPNPTSGGMVILLSIVTCGIYNWFWLYKMGERTDRIKMGMGEPSDGNSPIIFLLLGIFGLGIVSYALIQDTINRTTT